MQIECCRSKNISMYFRVSRRLRKSVLIWPETVLSLTLFNSILQCGPQTSVAFVIAMDVFGPITDNAGGIVEVRDLPVGFVGQSQNAILVTQS